jgi:hypothetical protein
LIAIECTSDVFDGFPFADHLPDARESIVANLHGGFGWL